nr:hypothetical protein [uncultured Tyzzerella sp.]
MDKYIISKNNNIYLIKVERYQEILNYIGIREFNKEKLKRWIREGKIDGLYDKEQRFYGVYVEEGLYISIFNNVNICDKCKYKDRLNVINNIINQG